MQTPLERVVELLKALGKEPKKQPRGNYRAHCPAHDDKNSSLIVSEGGNGQVLLHCHGGCGMNNVISSMGLAVADLFPVSATANAAPRAQRTTATVATPAAPVSPTAPATPAPKTKRNILTVAALAADKVIPEGFLLQLGLRDLSNGVGIPYRAPDGSVVAMKLRSDTTAKKGSKWPSGVRLMPYGLDRKINGPALVLVEGESDAWTLWHNGYDALGLPGASTASVLELSHLGTASTVFVVKEPDRGGVQFIEGVTRRLGGLGYAGRVVCVEMIGAKDPNDLWKLDPKVFKVAFDSMLQHASASALRSAATHAKPTIRVTTDIQHVVNEAEKAIASNPALEVYQRSGMLARITFDAAHGVTHLSHDPAPPTIETVMGPALREMLSMSAKWISTRSRGGVNVDVEIMPPDWVTSTLAERGKWELPVLDGLTNTPIVRGDFSIHTLPGYDPMTGIVFVEPKGFGSLSLPDTVSVDEAYRAASDFLSVFSEFPFVNAVDMAAVLSMALTLLMRSAVRGPTPLFAIRAPVPGTGKSLLVRAIGLATTGYEPSLMAHSRDEEELRKRSLALAMESIPFVVLDNIEEALGSGTMAAMLTSVEIRDRLLGTSRTVTVPMRTVWAATGNNLVFKGDLYRRVVPIDLDAGVERPESRTFTRPDLIRYVKVNRCAMLSQLFTVIIGWRQAGCPAHGYHRYGSFEAWDDSVRSAVAWALGVDPCGGRERIREEGDIDIERMRALFMAWSTAHFSGPVSVKELVAAARGTPSLHEALVALDPRSDGFNVNTRTIGFALRKWKGRIARGLRLVAGEVDRNGIRKWCIESTGGDDGLQGFPRDAGQPQSGDPSEEVGLPLGDERADGEEVE